MRKTGSSLMNPSAAAGILVDGGQQSDIRGNILSNDNRILFVNSDGSTVTVLSGN